MYVSQSKSIHVATPAVALTLRPEGNQYVSPSPWMPAATELKMLAWPEPTSLTADAEQFWP